jgi:GT2 family glycosyltransferase
VSIVIVTYNTGGRFIEDCLASLRRLDHADHETIVVDNASKDGTRGILERCRRDEILVFNDENRGFAGGCNDGIARARGEIVALLNFDTEVEPSWLTELVRPFREDPRIAIAGCKMLFPDGRIQHAGGVVHGNGMSEHIGYREADEGQYEEELDVDYVTGAGLAVRREFLEMCGGGLDEDYFPAYCEEVDLCYRARLMGYRVVYVPRAVLTHHESAVLENQSPLFQRVDYRNRVLFCLKNYRLREWLFDFVPYEVHWLRAPWSKGLRRKQVRAYLDALGCVVGRRGMSGEGAP